MNNQNHNFEQKAAGALKVARRQTPNRLEILEILERAHGPLSAAEIHALALRKRPHIGLATIYRALKMMQEEERVRFVTLPDGAPRYEPAGRSPHHFQCRVCHGIRTIPNAPLRVLNGVRLGEAWLIEDHSSTFYGRCEGCKSIGQSSAPTPDFKAKTIER